MNDKPDQNEAVQAGRKEPAKEVQLRCTVTAETAEIGKLTVGKGHKCRLPESKAKALAALKPPVVRIDGV